MQKSVPLLFRSAQIYRLFETDCCERKFDYHNNERDFERLVCRMVGIDRAQLNAPNPGAVFEMTKPASLSGKLHFGISMSYVICFGCNDLRNSLCKSLYAHVLSVITSKVTYVYPVNPVWSHVGLSIYVL